MTNAAYPIDPNSLLTKTADAKSLGATYADAYQSGEPYNHICIDNFLPTDAIDKVIEDLKQLPEPESDFSRPQENLKSSYIPERLPEYTKNLFYAFNSRSFIAFLESMTGIQGLIPDPYFFGAGIHKTQNGGHLDIHADFNVHSVMRVERRLNVLIYLNHDWQEEWGGNFEIWDKKMAKKMASFVPTYNRMVCFSTGSDTFHGNPEPVNHPNGEPRQSIALYYYTATWDGSRKEHTTLFKPRPGTADQEDRHVARRERIQDFLPPVVYRKIAGHLHRIGL